jgi:hypothetical protein
MPRRAKTKTPKRTGALNSALKRGAKQEAKDHRRRTRGAAKR